MAKKSVVVIGAGPAGLTASLELLRQKDFSVCVLEASSAIGGISKTVQYKGYRIDIGGHRFFSKSTWVMNWWQKIMRIQQDDNTFSGLYRQTKSTQNDLNMMMVRKRLSRIFYKSNFYDYPLKACLGTALKLGLRRVCLILISYIYAKLRPIQPEKNLEDFLINRFGKKLYLTFFNDYTEKVWGVPCRVISPNWGVQRIKSLSISKLILHAFKQIKVKRNSISYCQSAQTSLIENFLYPKQGPGQMWESVANRVKDLGGTIKINHKASKLLMDGNLVKAVIARNVVNQNEDVILADYVVSTMPVKDLIYALAPKPSDEVVQVAKGLQYRDFITVGLLLKKLRRTKGCLTESTTNLVPDNWIYIQDKEVKVGRLQIFNNWSPYLIADPSKVWLGMEYFCQEGDYFWKMADSDLIHHGIKELSKIGLANQNDLIDGVVIRTPKAYPCYFGSYDQFSIIRDFVDTIDNLFLVGRNGMHRYNNQDHSMLTARYAANAIIKGSKDKKAIWEVNIDDDYHEE